MSQPARPPAVARPQAVAAAALAVSNLQDGAAGGTAWQPELEAGAPLWAWGLAAALLLALLLLLGRALRQAGRFRVDRALPEAEQQRVRAAVEAAETRTIGEILPVVLGRSDRYPAADLWCAIVFGLTAYLAAWALWAELPPPALLGCALIVAAVGWLASRRLPGLRRTFVAPWRMQEQAEEQAYQEFFRHGLHRTAERTGVLLFVSLFERRVVVLGDEGIGARLPDGVWTELDDGILAGARHDRLGEGLARAVERMGAILAEEFPWSEGDRDELPNRVVVRSE